MRMAKQWTRTFRIESSLYLLVILSAAIKLSFTFLGPFIRNLATLLFLVDYVISFGAILGIYFWLDERLRKKYIY